MANGSKQATRTKRYFISDIHLTDEASHKQPRGRHAYAWITGDRIKLLGKFLDDLLKDSTTRDVVILGDLFDNWLCPASGKPSVLEDIVNAKTNEPVIKALRAFEKSDVNLFYVYGNHDMTMDKNELLGSIKGMKIIGDGRQAGVFRPGLLAAEHGHKYGLFNAPDTKHVGSYLPSGYAITRMVAENSAKTGKSTGSFDDMISAVKDALEHIEEPLVEQVLEGLARVYGFDNPDFIMPQGDKKSLDDMVKLHGDDYKVWGKDTNGVKALTAVLDDMGSWGGNLGQAVEDVYFNNEGAKIVVFGHTHVPALRTFPENPYLIDDSGNRSDPECEAIYANSGSWVDSCKKATWVETEKDPVAKKHWVRLRWYDEKGNKKKTLKESFVPTS